MVNLYAAKTDGRLIKIANASILPDSPQWLDINEERYLSHPDKVETGDMIVTAKGKAVGLITREYHNSNRTRLRAHIFDYLSFEDCFKIPVSKSNKEIYYSKFVSSVKEIYRGINR